MAEAGKLDSIESIESIEEVESARVVSVETGIQLSHGM